MSVLQRARESGSCPPSLLAGGDNPSLNQAFEAALGKFLDANGTSVTRRLTHADDVGLIPFTCLLLSPSALSLTPGLQSAENFRELLKVRLSTATI